MTKLITSIAALQLVERGVVSLDDDDLDPVLLEFSAQKVLMVDAGKVLKKETAKMMFEPQLTKKSKMQLLEVMETPDWFVGDFPRTREYDWDLGGALIDGDSHDFRRQGALIWGGAANLFWVRTRYIYCE